MSNSVKRKVDIVSNRAWDAVIVDAQQKLEEAKKRVKGLRRAIRNFTKLRDAGQPWPGGSTTQN